MVLTLSLFEGHQRNLMILSELLDGLYKSARHRLDGVGGKHFGFSLLAVELGGPIHGGDVSLSISCTQAEPVLAQRAGRGRGKDEIAGRAHGKLVGQGKKGMQGKETVGVLSLRCRQFEFCRQRSKEIHMLVGLRRSLVSIGCRRNTDSSGLRQSISSNRAESD